MTANGHAPPPERPPLVSVVVPCREEAGFIARFLDSVLATTWPHDRLQVLVVDGESRDGTRDIISTYAQRHSCIRLVDNPARSTPAALNCGIVHAGGEIIVRMDVHSVYPPHYITTLVGWLRRSGADNVGTTAVTCAGADTSMARAIAVALAHPVGVGNAWFRIGVTEPRWVDTVWFGCYRRDVFARIGLFDEELARNQDDELNARLRRAGGRILLVPDATFRYFARSTLRKLARMYFQYGRFKPLAQLKARSAPSLRQLAPPLFVLALLGTTIFAVATGEARPFTILAGAWGVTIVGASLLAARRTGLTTALRLPAAFATLHVAYGAGYLQGLADLARTSWLGRRPAADVRLSR